MESIDFSHNIFLVAASLCVALMAGFTGLSLTKGLSERSVPQRKIAIALAAVALGGGIWSMHFVGMLGLQMPFIFYYDALITLASALVAILVVGLALLLLHFGQRTRGRLVLAGVIVGLGVIAMHYIGMAGLELCRALYTPTGILFSVLASCLLNIMGFGIAYGHRSNRNILLGTCVFGLAVFSVHFVAIASTEFVQLDAVNTVGPTIGNETLAIGVVLSSFVLCGAFLLTGATFLPTEPVIEAPEAETPPEDPTEEVKPFTAASAMRQIPYTRDGRTLFIDWMDVAAIRAEGHYIQIYTKEGHFFSAWSITEAEKRLADTSFLKAHRSYLINPTQVSGFERLKDTGVCFFDCPDLPKVPVSRSRLKPVREALGV
ncbi:MAG: MHYT domain-containing protein [Pseudoruegeria sp.]